MDNLPVCKLCKRLPYRKSDGIFVEHVGNVSCPMAGSDEMTPEQWAALMSTPEPDMFWISDRPEDSFGSIEDIADDVVSSGWTLNEDETEIMIDLAVSLPKRKIICWGEPDEDGDIQAKWKWATGANDEN